MIRFVSWNSGVQTGFFFAVVPLTDEHRTGCALFPDPPNFKGRTRLSSNWTSPRKPAEKGTLTVVVLLQQSPALVHRSRLHTTGDPEI